MQTQVLPDDPLEREFESLTRKLRLGQGFCFIVYFVEDQRASLYIKTRLRELIRGKGGELTEVAIDTPADLATATLRAIFDATGDSAPDGLRVPVWVEAFRGPGESAWQARRTELLMRMNERRSRFESELRRPLILLLPAGAQREAATLAPDLWHVRVHSATLSIVGSEPSLIDRDGLASDIRISSSVRGELLTGAIAPATGVPREVAYWQSLLDAAFAEAGNSKIDVAAVEGALDSLSLWDGFAAIDAWLAVGRLPESLELANQILALARARARQGEDADPLQTRQTERDVAVALGKVGDVQRGAGRIEAALAAYREGLEVTRESRSTLGNEPEVLRDLSVSLIRVGDTERDAGRIEAALEAYRESLALTRQLRTVLGDGLQELRDLSVSLERVGDAEHDVGHVEAALATYYESLALARQLRKELGDGPQVLRDLLVSLNKVADAERDAGRGEAALTAYREGLELARQLQVRTVLGDSPQVLRDLSVSLIRVGDAEQDSGHSEAALAAYLEGLELTRRLRTALGDVPKVLDDLSVSLERLASSTALDTDVRRQMASEAVGLRESLVATLPDSQRHQSRLAVARKILDGLSQPAAGRK